MAEISNKFENWPDSIINLKSYIALIAEKTSFWLCHHYYSFIFDRMILKLVYNVDMDKISDKFESGQILLLIVELRPIDCWKASVWQSSL